MQASSTSGGSTDDGSTGNSGGSTGNSGSGSGSSGPMGGYVITEVIKYYPFNGQKMAMRICPSTLKVDPECQLRYLHSDHLGSILMTTDLARSDDQRVVHRRYDAYGLQWADERGLNSQEGTNDLATDHRFTGQKADGTGLMYYNARYYDPQLGMFISPDSIVPDPTNVFDYNRYLYVRGNPLNMIDPTGHIAICFQGGDFNTEAEAPIEGSGFLSMCQNSLNNAGYSEKNHGQILYLTNGTAGINYAYEEITKAKELDPNEPIIIIGYSWGGAAALDLADKLGPDYRVRSLAQRQRTISVDLLYLIDPEDDFRGYASRKIGPFFGRGVNANSRTAPTSVGRHVKTAINVFAEDANTFRILGDQIEGGIPAYEWSWANGLNNINGAVNIGVQGVNHYSIINFNTAIHLQRYIDGALYGYPFVY